MNRLAAEFFASLASTKELASLEQWQKEKLLSDARKAQLLRSYRDKDWVLGEGARKQWPGILDSWVAGRIPAAWVAIWTVQPWAHRLINALVDSGKVDVRAFNKEMLKPATWKIENGKVVEEYIGYEHADKELWVDLGRLVLTSDPFPFRRCALCRKIFVPASRKQKKYCGKECANKAVSLKPARRKYMKNYMAEKRETEKNAR